MEAAAAALRRGGLQFVILVCQMSEVYKNIKLLYKIKKTFHLFCRGWCALLASKIHRAHHRTIYVHMTSMVTLYMILIMYIIRCVQLPRSLVWFPNVFNLMKTFVPHFLYYFVK